MMRSPTFLVVITRGKTKITSRWRHQPQKTVNRSGLLATPTLSLQKTPQDADVPAAIAIQQRQNAKQTQITWEKRASPWYPTFKASQLYFVPILYLPGHQLFICAAQQPTEIQRGLLSSFILVMQEDRFGVPKGGGTPALLSILRESEAEEPLPWSPQCP